MIHEALSDTSNDQYILTREKEDIDDRGDLLQLQNMNKLSCLEYSRMEGRRSEDVQHEGEKFFTSNPRRPAEKCIAKGEVERLGNEVVNDGEEVLERVMENDDRTKVIQIKEIEKTKTRDVCVSNVDVEMGGYEDGVDLMSILKEKNEAIALKRRRQKEKA
ncbi:hypothetical protein PIB30_082791, partial [Stylosanthes scabra]|nr:hypothetical protein [Stylosanthes scabra]